MNRKTIHVLSTVYVQESFVVFLPGQGKDRVSDNSRFQGWDSVLKLSTTCGQVVTVRGSMYAPGTVRPRDPSVG